MTYLQCPQCDSFACDPIEAGDACHCGEGTYSPSTRPFEGFEMGCCRCRYELSAISTGKCEHGESMNYTNCGVT